MAGEEPLEASPTVAPAFRYDVGVLNALTFMMIGHHRDKGPGVVRPGGIYIRSSGSGEAVHEGPDGDLVPGLLDELIQWLNEGDLDVPNHVRAAMAHLNPVKVHPMA